MDRSAPNTNIRCSVSQCLYHCGDQNFCSLRTIKVDRCAAQVNNSAATECASFETQSLR